MQESTTLQKAAVGTTMAVIISTIVSLLFLFLIIYIASKAWKKGQSNG